MEIKNMTKVYYEEMLKSYMFVQVVVMLTFENYVGGEANFQHLLVLIRNLEKGVFKIHYLYKSS